MLIGAIGIPAAASWAEPTAKAARAPGTDSLLEGMSFTKSHEPVNVTADALEFDYRRRVLIYRGDVLATQGTLELRSDTLTISMTDEPGTHLQSVVAQGHVQMTQGDRSATAGRAEFNQGERTVILSQDAVLNDGPNHVAGDRVTVYLDSQRSVVEGGGGQRVRAVLFPPASPSRSPAAATPGAEAVPR